MTELFGKDSDDPDVSGWGHELTMRLPRTGDQPPEWSLRLLQQLPPIDSPFGSATFLTVAGITADELDRMKATSTAEVLRELGARSPLLVTDPSR